MTYKFNIILKTIFFVKKHDYIAVPILLFLLIFISFFNVICQNETLVTSHYVHGLMPDYPDRYSLLKVGSIPISSWHLPVIDPGASAWQYEPELCLNSRIIRSHEMPLWNPYIACGIPLAAGMISAAFYPLNFIIYLTPPNHIADSMDFILLLRLLLAGFFTYCFMRELRISKSGSIISAIAFMFNGYLILYINMTHLNVEILVPLLLFSMEKLIKNQNIKYSIFSALIIAFSIFGGMPESTLFSFFLAGLYYLFRSFCLNKSELNGIIHPIKWLFISFSLGLLLSMPLTLPFIEFLHYSWNFHPDSIGLRYMRFNFDTISLIIPYFFGPINNTWNDMGQYRLMPYLGILPVFFALSSLSRTNKNLYFVLFFTSFSIFYILKSYGLPVINLIGLLPLFNVSIFYKYCYVEFALSISILAGIGFDNLPAMNLKRMLSQLTLMLSFIVFFAIGNIPQAVSAIPTKPLLLFWSVINLLQALFIIFILLTIIFLYHRHPRHIRKITTTLMILLIVELIIYIPHDRAERTDPFEHTPYIDFLKSDQGVYRVVALNNLFYPNVANTYGIFDIREFYPLNIARYKTFIQEMVYPYPRFNATNLEITKENLRILSFLNVKYILSNSYLDSMTKDIIEKCGTSSNGTQLSETVMDGKGALFQHPPSTITYPLHVPEGISFLNFSIGLSPDVWSSDKGDGVLFEIILNESGTTHRVFSKYIDPKNRLEDRIWHVQNINLSAYRGKDISLSFITSPGNSTKYDWSVWRDLNILSPGTDKHLDKYPDLELVYDNEIKIYENKAVLPRIFMVNEAISQEMINESFKSVLDDEFDFSEVVLLEGFSSELTNQTDSLNDSHPYKTACEIFYDGTIRVIARVNATRSGFLVMTDTYYPGWNAYVDGTESKILIANHAFRAIFLEQGNHYIEFVYDPLSFRAGLLISLITLIVLILYMFIIPIHFYSKY